MHKAQAYQALMHELERWRVEIEIWLAWEDAQHASIRVAGTVNGRVIGDSSGWKTQW